MDRGLTPAADGVPSTLTLQQDCNRGGGGGGLLTSLTLPNEAANLLQLRGADPPCTLALQDYNREVLTSLTMPNVAANLQQLPGSCQRPASRFWAGEWRAVAQQLQGEQLAGSYDIVLSAETIYNADSQEALLSCIKQVRARRRLLGGRTRLLLIHAALMPWRRCLPASQRGGGMQASQAATAGRRQAGSWSVCPPAGCTSQAGAVVNGQASPSPPPPPLCPAGPQVLKPPDGVAFIAAKSFYFGVGGGTAAFAQRVQQDGTLVCRQVRRCS